MSSINRLLTKVRPLSKLRDSAPPLALLLVADAAVAAAVRVGLIELGWNVTTDPDQSKEAVLLVSDTGEAFDSDRLGGRVLIAEHAGVQADESLGLPIDAQRLATIAQRWDPRETIAGARRLAALFGEAAIAGSLEGLRDQLAAALQGSGLATAHRIAGLAGTLGFPEASAAWLAVSEGEPDALPAARREARRVLLAIDAAVDGTA